MLKVIKTIFKFMDYGDKDGFVSNKEIKDSLDVFLTVDMDPILVQKGVEYFSNKKQKVNKGGDKINFQEFLALLKKPYNQNYLFKDLNIDF